MKGQRFMLSIDASEIEEILSSGLLYTWNSVHVIDPTTREFTFDKSNEGYLEKTQRIRNSFLSGSSIIVQGLERYSLKLREYSLRFSPSCTIHMYLTPEGGAPSFDFHSDDTDVYVYMALGHKRFELIREEGLEIREIKQGQGMLIPKGVVHRASSIEATCLLSFGFTRYQDFAVPPVVRKEDFESTNRVSF
jgi:mannose-6-phosphate isomerase-like protein (cupin superfamily)